uniref:Uncharacterized protein n=1 Tax=Candidatus Kentrum sp. DK TaxID=2126562 RepID=A0A450SIM5_9GAMM|nr:MAG: hypothetical protein BECKDK2373C_GA0170839_10394 [Candidatus Kentron sp. DK]
MQLSEQENGLFFDIMWPLLLYACKKLGTVPEVDSMEDLMALDFEHKVIIRDALFENPRIIEEFAAEDPAGLGEERLSIARSWQGFVKGKFYIERYLKRYAIFILEDKVYAVQGLRSSFDEIFPKRILPVYLEVILLPFQGRIVYDGFMRPYNVRFGSGVKDELKEIYGKAKQNGRIITSLDAGAKPPEDKQEVIPMVDWSRVFRRLTDVAQTLKGNSGQPAINAAAFSLIRASIDLGNHALAASPDRDTLFADLHKVKKALSKVENVLHRME